MEIAIGKLNLARFSYALKCYHLKFDKETRDIIEAFLTLHKHLSMGVLKEVCMSRQDEWFYDKASRERDFIIANDGEIVGGAAHSSYWQLGMKWEDCTAYLMITTQHNTFIDENVTTLILEFLTPNQVENIRRFIDEGQSVSSA